MSGGTVGAWPGKDCQRPRTGSAPALGGPATPPHRRWQSVSKIKTRQKDPPKTAADEDGGGEGPRAPRHPHPGPAAAGLPQYLTPGCVGQLGPRRGAVRSGLRARVSGPALLCPAGRPPGTSPAELTTVPSCAPASRLSKGGGQPAGRGAGAGASALWDVLETWTSVRSLMACPVASRAGGGESCCDPPHHTPALGTHWALGAPRSLGSVRKGDGLTHASPPAPRNPPALASALVSPL